MSEEIRELCRRAKISEYLQARGHQLIRLSRGWKGCCPLHQERTPSFHVREMPDGREAFNCFGCDEWGDIVDLIEKLEGKRKGEVIGGLAKQFGVTLGKFNPAVDRGKPDNSEIMTVLCEEEEVCSRISKYGRALIEKCKGSADIVDKVSMAYQRADELVELGDRKGLESVFRNLKLLMKEYEE